MIFRSTAEQLRPGYYIDGAEIMMVCIYPSKVRVQLLTTSERLRKYDRYEVVEYELRLPKDMDLC